MSAADNEMFDITIPWLWKADTLNCRPDSNGCQPTVGKADNVPEGLKTIADNTVCWPSFSHVINVIVRWNKTKYLRCQILIRLQIILLTFAGLSACQQRNLWCVPYGYKLLTNNVAINLARSSRWSDQQWSIRFVTFTDFISLRADSEVVHFVR